MKHIRKWLSLLGVLALVMIGLQFTGAGPASAHGSPSPAFKSYTQTCVWLMPAGTISPDYAWPQTLVNCDGTVPTDCGKSYQVDTYHITSKDMDKDFQKFIDKGSMRSSADDSEFSPNPYHGVYNDRCKPDQPAPVITKTPHEVGNCATSAVITWTTTTTTPYVFDVHKWKWVLGSPTSSDSAHVSTPMTPAQEAQYDCAIPLGPPNETRTVPGTAVSCTTGTETWVDTYTTTYTWDKDTWSWTKNAETGPVRSDDQFTPLTPEENLANNCAGPKPDAKVDTVTGHQDSCALGGFETRTGTITTEYVLNADNTEWVLGTPGDTIWGDWSAVTPYDDASLCTPVTPPTETTTVTPPPSTTTTTQTVTPPAATKVVTQQVVPAANHSIPAAAPPLATTGSDTEMTIGIAAGLLILGSLMLLLTFRRPARRNH